MKSSERRRKADDLERKTWPDAVTSERLLPGRILSSDDLRQCSLGGGFKRLQEFLRRENRKRTPGVIWFVAGDDGADSTFRYSREMLNRIFEVFETGGECGLNF